MNFIHEYINGYFVNTRKYFPDTFNSNIAFVNVLVFGLTSLIMFFFYEPLSYLFFLIIFTSTESDANIFGNELCNKIVQKIDVIVIAIIVLLLFLKTDKIYGLFLLPVIFIHHWKRDAKNSEEYELKMNIWHFFASFISILTISMHSLYYI